MIPVTKPFFPPLEEYQELVNGIWQRQWITNHGPLVLELESKLKKLLGIDHMLFLSNGTIALQIAIKALDLKGEIITTPYSYVATTSSIVWEGCIPVFVDIDPHTFNIDPMLIEAAVTPKTTAILATHVYGNPCDVEVISAIASKYNLKVIYDGAHAFAVKVHGRSVFEYGDICTGSFHATKLFHTAEGGAVYTKYPALHQKMSLLRNFGHTSPISFDGIGVNGKNSELHAAVGLSLFKYLPSILEKKKEQSGYYADRLRELGCGMQKIHPSCDYNYAYFPLILESEEMVLEVMKAFEKRDIYARRYFYPSLSTLDYVRPSHCEISENIARRALCLPLYHTLSQAEQDLICDILINVHKSIVRN